MLADSVTYVYKCLGCGATTVKRSADRNHALVAQARAQERAYIVRALAASGNGLSAAYLVEALPPESEDSK